MRHKLPFIWILILLFITSCNKDAPTSAEELKKDEMRRPFIGVWNFTMTHYFEGFVYDEINDTSTFQTLLDTVWVKRGSIIADPNSYDGLIVNYGPDEKDFIVTTDGLDVTCISACENAGYDTLGPYAGWWFLAEGSYPYDSAAIYNMGVSEYYGSPNSWSIVGFPE